MHDFTASASTGSFGLAWGPETIYKERGTSPEEGVPQARTTAGSPDCGLTSEGEAPPRV